MKRYFSLVMIMLFLFLTSCSIDQKQVKPVQEFNYRKDASVAGFSKDRLTYIDSVMSRLVKDGILPNAVTFVARHGVVVHNKAFGWKNIENRIPVKTDDIFRLASQTKAITSVALMTLYEEGRFLLDDPVSKFIPEFKNTIVMETFNEKDTTFTTRPAVGNITIRHLLTHTSGIHYGIIGGRGPGNMIFAKNGIPAANSLEPITIEQLVKKIAGLPIMFDPGEKYLYGMNIDVIGYLIEILSGKPLDVFMKERIFDPLGMNDTYFYLPQNKADRLVSLYGSGRQGLEYSSNVSYQTYPVAGAKTLFLGGAGLCGPIGDYAKFCQMILNGGTFNDHRILSRKTIQLMTMNQIGDKNIGRLNNKFGLGFEIFSEENAANHLASVGALRWGGMYSTDFQIDPKEDLILLIYTNIAPYSGPNFQYLFHNMVFQALE
jgi:CubicO group peptidase (beta-lactamase class C family)